MNTEYFMQFLIKPQRISPAPILCWEEEVNNSRGIAPSFSLSHSVWPDYNLKKHPLAVLVVIFVLHHNIGHEIYLQNKQERSL